MSIVVFIEAVFTGVLPESRLAHEVGHLLGLWHNEATIAAASDIGVNEVVAPNDLMQRFHPDVPPTNTTPANAIGFVSESSIPLCNSQNCRDYLRHHVDGVPAEQLNLGSWDRCPDTILNVFFAADDTDLVLYDAVAIAVQDYHTQQMLVCYDRVSVGQLGGLNLSAPIGTKVVAMGASEPGGPVDLVFAVRPPTSPEDMELSVTPTNRQELALYRVSSNAAPVVVATGEFTVAAVEAETVAIRDMALEPAAPQQFEWMGRYGIRYQLEAADEPDGTYTPEGPSWLGSGGLERGEAFTPSAGRKFYRLRTVPEP